MAFVRPRSRFELWQIEQCRKNIGNHYSKSNNTNTIYNQTVHVKVRRSPATPQVEHKKSNLLLSGGAGVLPIMTTSPSTQKLNSNSNCIKVNNAINGFKSNIVLGLNHNNINNSPSAFVVVDCYDKTYLEVSVESRNSSLDLDKDTTNSEVPATRLRSTFDVDNSIIFNNVHDRYEDEHIDNTGNQGINDDHDDHDDGDGDDDGGDQLNNYESEPLQQHYQTAAIQRYQQNYYNNNNNNNTNRSSNSVMPTAAAGNEKNADAVGGAGGATATTAAAAAQTKIIEAPSPRGAQMSSAATPLATRTAPQNQSSTALQQNTTNSNNHNNNHNNQNQTTNLNSINSNASGSHKTASIVQNGGPAAGAAAGAGGGTTAAGVGGSDVIGLSGGGAGGAGGGGGGSGSASGGVSGGGSGAVGGANGAIGATSGGTGAHNHNNLNNSVVGNRGGHTTHNNNHNFKTIETDTNDDEEYDIDDQQNRHYTRIGSSQPVGGYWGGSTPAAHNRSQIASRAASPLTMMDNMSEQSSQMPHQQPQQQQPLPSQGPSMAGQSSAGVGGMPRSKSRNDMSSRYGNLSYWKARRVVFYRNGDPFFPGVEYRFKPGRDIGTIEALLDKISPRLDLPRGARYVFSMDGDRKYSLDELEDGASYVVSSFKIFKPASYGKKNGMWYASPGNQGWGSKPSMSRKPSVVEADIAPPASNNLKPSAGRVIRIINNLDHGVQCRVLLNLRTSQPFEEVVEDLGQVLKMTGAKRMFTASGQEVRSFSQLRNEFAEMDTFYLSAGPMGTITPGTASPIRRSRSRASIPGPIVQEDLSKTTARQRARSKSRPRVLYAPDNEIVRTASDYSLVDVLKEEPTKVVIRGLRRTFYPPLHHPPMDNSPPDKKLQLQWVHGYRGIDARRNLWVLPSGELLYYVAAVAILLDREEESQRHYLGHTEDIMCMDVHPSRELVASGQRAGRDRKSQAHLRIWSTESLQTLYVFGMGELDGGVLAVAFSQLNGGSYVLAVDAGRESILSVWQWQWGHLLGKVATLQEGLSGASFHPLDDNLIITHGRGHLSFWHRRKDGFFERTDIIKPPSRTHVTSIQFEPDGDVVTADSDGFITVYSVDSDGAYFVRMEFEAHNKGISCLVMLSEGTLLSGGEKDRKIAAWDSLQNYKRITDTKLPESAGGVRTIYPQRPGRNDGNIYVGTTRNNILEGSLQRRFNQVVFGHGRQLWGLAAHPEDDLFATAGHDKNIALWRKHKLLWSTQVGNECISLAFHPFGSAIAAGSTEGHLLILNAENGAAMLTLRICGSPLNCISYNQVGDMIAMGSQNGSIYLFRVSRDGFSYKKVNKIRGSQPLAHLDWSVDGNYLQTVTIDFDLLFWDVRSLSPEKSPIAMKDVKWATHNATVGFMVAGMWNNRYYSSTSATLTTCNRSAGHDMLASGDSDGYLRLFRFPCMSPRAEYAEAKVYSGSVACARFLYGDRSVVTVGGTDASLMVWELAEE